MDRHSIDHYLGAFCHLDPDRSYLYGEVVSLLCHRCSAIYGSFLIVALFGWVSGWKGQILSWKSQRALVVSGVVFLALCGLQVLVQGVLPAYGGGAYGRVLAGMAVAIGLFQFSQAGKGAFPLADVPRSLFPLLLIVLGFHVFFLGQSFWYGAVVSLLGLFWLYHQINLQVLGPWLKGRPVVFMHGVIVLAMVLEWLFLYSINVLKIHV